MIGLSKKKKDAPQLFENPELAEGVVYVAVEEGAGFRSRYKGGEEGVLETAAGGRLELKTAEKVRSKVTDEGTYLSPKDMTSLDSKVDGPTLRRYGLGDTLAKAESKAGVLLILATVIGLIAAIFGLVVAIEGESGTTPASVAERSQALIAWVAEPSDMLERNVPPETVVSVRESIDRRQAVADRCLTVLRGGEGQVSQVAGVKCTTNDVPWWKDKDLAALAAVIAGALGTFLGMFGVLTKFGFRRSPAAE